MADKLWVGVDLDGTLAFYDKWRGKDHIGKPIRPMIDKVKKALRKGVNIKIFTARASISEQVPPVKKWLIEQGLGDLEITNQKDRYMMELWDDRCMRVIKNEGRICYGCNGEI